MAVPEWLQTTILNYRSRLILLRNQLLRPQQSADFHTEIDHKMDFYLKYIETNRQSTSPRTRARARTNSKSQSKKRSQKMLNKPKRHRIEKQKSAPLHQSSPNNLQHRHSPTSPRNQSTSSSTANHTNHYNHSHSNNHNHNHRPSPIASNSPRTAAAAWSVSPPSMSIIHSSTPTKITTVSISRTKTTPTSEIQMNVNLQQKPQQIIIQKMKSASPPPLSPNIASNDHSSHNNAKINHNHTLLQHNKNNVTKERGYDTTPELSATSMLSDAKLQMDAGIVLPSPELNSKQTDTPLPATTKNGARAASDDNPPEPMHKLTSQQSQQSHFTEESDEDELDPLD
mmetsp:Transcript_20637/g.32864  ORF Transcript_20637/g.32864 Transcript_20637/m.32864 type:complete len:341 (+) Transcript_20637:1416-2438(+)